MLGPEDWVRTIAFLFLLFNDQDLRLGHVDLVSLLLRWRRNNHRLLLLAHHLLLHNWLLLLHRNLLLLHHGLLLHINLLLIEVLRHDWLAHERHLRIVIGLTFN